MSSTQFQRILASCEIFWGKGDYDLDIETDGWMTYCVVVKKDLGISFEPPLIMTGACGSEDHPWGELDRMLRIWAEQIWSGQLMTDDQRLEIFGGPSERNKPILRPFIARINEREMDSTVRQAPGEIDGQHIRSRLPVAAP
ncbi:hypothetical protein BDV23DRAFT_188700 [Aspergillus alliaceus]|uniref:Uncharacterized protein n=1 Tax=Petromyces alliaceus TaxID=209559 RepID=A0A5N7BT13_PETAA|nr:hypothetical protein BDV23DRAFT_188700 [Aspergillus alliaceus]